VQGMHMGDHNRYVKGLASGTVLRRYLGLERSSDVALRNDSQDLRLWRAAGEVESRRGPTATDDNGDGLSSSVTPS
jgi:hypothetical protein